MSAETKTVTYQTLWPSVTGLSVVDWHTSPLGHKEPRTWANWPEEYAAGVTQFTIVPPTKVFVRKQFLGKTSEPKIATLVLTDDQLSQIVADLQTIRCTSAEYEGGVVSPGHVGNYNMFVQADMVRDGLKRTDAGKWCVVAEDGRQGFPQDIWNLSAENRQCVVMDNATGPMKGDENKVFPHFRLPDDLTHESLRNRLNKWFERFAAAPSATVAATGSTAATATDSTSATATDPATTPT
jgi:hypothetical protein